MNNPSILFIPSASSINTGSYRIWIKDLSFYLSELGVKCKIGSASDIQNYDIVILGKSNNPKTQKPQTHNNINHYSGIHNNRLPL